MLTRRAPIVGVSYDYCMSVRPIYEHGGTDKGGIATWQFALLNTSSTLFTNVFVTSWSHCPVSPTAQCTPGTRPYPFSHALSLCEYECFVCTPNADTCDKGMCALKQRPKNTSTVLAAAFHRNLINADLCTVQYARLFKLNTSDGVMWNSARCNGIHECDNGLDEDGCDRCMPSIQMWWKTCLT